MILRYDRLGIEIPVGDPDPAGAMLVQDPMGGRFGEMSTFMNYTFQAFNFRARKELSYARALELLTGADLTKAFPMPRIATDKIPECRPHLERGSHLKLYRFTPDDYKELAAVFRGPHPETGEDLRVEHPAPDGFAWPEYPAQEDVFAPDYAPGEIAEIAQKLRCQAGFTDDIRMRAA